MRTPVSKNLYQLKVTLKGSEPPIWRRLLVRGDASLYMLHELIQVTMGWDNEHMHQFVFKRKKAALTPERARQFLSGRLDPSVFDANRFFSDPEMGLDDAEDENRTHLDGLKLRARSKFAYEYDFGDGWKHEILVEKVTHPDPLPEYPQCVAGEQACPPEDCGGLWGYYGLLEILADKKHPEYAERLEWMGPIDPENFDLDKVNKRLEEMYRPRPRKKGKRTT